MRASPCGLEWSRRLDGSHGLREHVLRPTFRSETHAHSFSGLAVVLSGEMHLGVGRRFHVLRSGQTFPLPAGLPHHESAGPAGARCLLLECDTEPLEHHGAGYITGHGSALAPYGAPAMAALIAGLRGGSDVIGGVAPRVLWAILGERPTRGSGPLPVWLARVWYLLEVGYARPRRVASLAHDFGISREYLTRVFRRAFGMSIGRYVRRRRLEESARLLAESAASLSHIALATGFCDQSHFTRVFRGHFKISPGAYRRIGGPSRSGHAAPA